MPSRQQQFATFREWANWYQEPNHDEIVLETNIPKVQELWLLLRSYSDSKNRAFELFEKYRIPETKHEQTWQRFKAFIHQAENFWHVAEQSPTTSSPLAYYYSYLNLAKAFLVLNNPRIGNKARHGLSFDVDRIPTSLSDQKISTIFPGNKKVEIFPAYYKAAFKTKAPGEFKIINLFGYLQEITSQFVSGGFGEVNWIPITSLTAINTQTNKYWGVVGISNRLSVREIKRRYPKFLRTFELTNIKSSSLYSLDFERSFNLKYPELVTYHFFQAKDSGLSDMISHESQLGIVPKTIPAKICKSFSPHLSPNLIDSPYTGYLFNPIKPTIGRSHAVNSELANYIIMYYLSSLVRYRPDHMENILAGEYKWLFDSYILSSPERFLHAICCRITKENFKLINI